MATTLYFHSAAWASGNEHGKWSAGTNLTAMDGTAQGWVTRRWHTAPGAAAVGRTRTTTVGPTVGQEVGATDQWSSAPMDSDITISGNITMNLRMGESTTGVNAGAMFVLQRIDNLGAVQETILSTEFGTEMGNTEAVQTWSATPTSTLLRRGDRMRARVLANDAGGTLAAGTVTFWVAGPTPGASGDSFCTFTETLPVVTDPPPATTTLYLTDTTSFVDPNGASFDAKEMWTSRGSGAVTAVRNSATGWTAPLLWTKTAGGNSIEWFSRELESFTLGGVVSVSMRGVESNAAANISPRFELAICDNDGTNPVIWAANTNNLELPTTDATILSSLAGDDTNVATGQRLRFRIYADDFETTAMVTGHTATLGYGSNTSGVGDTFIWMDETLVEDTGATVVAVGQVTETDTALPVDLGYEVNQVTETDTAHALVAATTVQGLVAVPISATAIHVTWDEFPGATGYDVERGGVVVAEFLPASPPEYQDTGLTPSTLYSYRVRAIT